MKTFQSAGEMGGATLGPGPWLTVDQERVNLFAEATGDHQWIHTDPERAAQGPFGGTVAHGYLTLSLLPMLMKDLYRVEGARMGVNYGLNKVRFPAPLRTGGKIRASAEVLSAEPTPDGGVQLVTRVTIEADGVAKPVCVAETVSRVYA